MKNEFKLDGCTKLVISTEGTQHTGHDGRTPHVGIEVLHTPLTVCSAQAAIRPTPPKSFEGFRFVSHPCWDCGLPVKSIDAPGSEFNGAAYEPVVFEEVTRTASDLPLGRYVLATIENVWPNDQHKIAWRAHECAGQPEPKALFAHTFKPSEARAIASMILLAANEARG